MRTIAVDAMGSDLGPEEVVKGAAQVSREEPPVTVRLVGDEGVLRGALDAVDADRSRIDVVHAPTRVEQADKPKAALDTKPDCSILRAAQLVEAGEADALVSAGNTGATILAAARTFERLPGVRRTALASVYPTVERHGPHRDPFALMLDVGATLHAEAEDLVGFAVMGSAYSQVVSSTEEPRVALLSNGSESTKGTPAIVEAHDRLRSLDGLRFTGNIEGLDIPKGSVEVVVCEGFLGNVVLKMLEGVSETAAGVARAAAQDRLVWKLALALLYPGIRKLRSMTDWRQYGGAPVLGFDKIVIKAHGRSNAWAIRNAIRVARKAADRDLVGRIRTGLPST